MLKHSVFALATFAAVGAHAAPAALDPANAKRCGELAGEAADLRDQIGAASAKKGAGFLAGMASRALIYAPGIDVGGGRLGQYAAQEAESAMHQQASSGLDKVRGDGRAANSENAEARLKDVRAQAQQLNCPKG